MSIGSNVNLKDRLIRKTADKASNVSKENIASKTSVVKDRDILRPNGDNIATKGTKKATFYVKKELLQKLYNFAYWERHSVTEAFNTALTDGLKGKNAKSIGR